MKHKTQILLIHGGETFKNRKDYLHYLKTKKISLEKRINWAHEYIENKLGKQYQVVRPRMPFQDNAKYADWKIMFERYLPLMNDRFILIGNSLGGIFLAKYLSENKLPRKALSTFLICAPFDDTMPGDVLAGGYKLKADLSMIEKNQKYLRFLFSKDDDVVPISHAEKYKQKLPGVDIIIYKSKNGHFNVPTFPEIVKMIRGDVKRT